MPESKILVKDIMVTAVISVLPSLSLIEAIKVIISHRFDGVPVIDRENRLLGILTEYDVIKESSKLGIPILQSLALEDLSGGDNFWDNFLEMLKSLKVQDVMNKEPLTLKSEATLEEAIMTFRDHHRVNPIPVISDDGKVIGVVSRFDVLKPFNLIDIE